MFLELCVIVCVQVGARYFSNKDEGEPNADPQDAELDDTDEIDGAHEPGAPGEGVELVADVVEADAVDEAAELALAEDASEVVASTPASTNANGIALSIASLGLAVVTSGTPLSLLSTGVISYSIAPISAKAWAKWRDERKFDNDTLFTLFSGLALVGGYNGAIAFGFVAYELGSHLLRKTTEQTRKIAFDSVSQLPRTAWLLVDGNEIEVPLVRLRVGDVVVVNSGEQIPIDGEIVEGQALIDQHQLTGEAQPAEKQAGDMVLASTLVTAGTIQIKVTKTGKDTSVAQIAHTLNEIAQAKTEVQSRGERLADSIALPTLALSGAALLGSGLPMAVVMLNSSFGNRIRVLGPLSTLNYLTIASQRGILVKSGTALEQINEVDTVLFDKTGTLTLPELKVGQITSYADFDEAQILAYAAAAEYRQEHPIAQAIKRAALERQLPLPECDDSEYRLGYGITVKLPGGERIHVGSTRFMTAEGVLQPAQMKREAELAQQAGTSLVAVAVASRVIGTIAIETQVRPEVPEIIVGLRKRGVEHMALVSGDHVGATRSLAGALGIDDYFAQVLPTDKADIVRELQEQGRVVCFIGDGVNDSVAMQQADVSISLAGASTIATDSAAVVLMNGSLDNLCELFDIAQKLSTNVRRSVGLLAASSVLNVGGALIFGLGVGGSVVVKAISSLAAVGNSALPLLEHEPPVESNESAA